MAPEPTTGKGLATGRPGPTEQGQKFDLCPDPGGNFELFPVVKQTVGPARHALDLHPARTIRDGGTQIGIETTGD